MGGRSGGRGGTDEVHWVKQQAAIRSENRLRHEERPKNKTSWVRSRWQSWEGLRYAVNRRLVKNKASLLYFTTVLNISRTAVSCT